MRTFEPDKQLVEAADHLAGSRCRRMTTPDQQSSETRGNGSINVSPETVPDVDRLLWINTERSERLSEDGGGRLGAAGPGGIDDRIQLAVDPQSLEDSR